MRLNERPIVLAHGPSRRRRDPLRRHPGPPLRRGLEVHIAAATPGDCGTPDQAPDAIAAIRRGEGRAAAAVLGGTWHCLESRDLLVFYDEHDGAPGHGPPAARPAPPGDRPQPPGCTPDHEQMSIVARAACFNGPVPNAPAGRRSPASPRVPMHAPIRRRRGSRTSTMPTRRRGRTTPDGPCGPSCAWTSRRWRRPRSGSWPPMPRSASGCGAITVFMSTSRPPAGGGPPGALDRTGAGEGFRQHRGHAFPADDLLRKSLGGRARWLGTGEGGERCSGAGVVKYIQAAATAARAAASLLAQTSGGAATRPCGAPRPACGRRRPRFRPPTPRTWPPPDRWG